MALKYTVTLDFAALWETSNAVILRRQHIAGLLEQSRRTTDEPVTRALEGILARLEDAETELRRVLDVPEPIPAGEAPGVYTEAYGL